MPTVPQLTGVSEEQFYSSPALLESAGGIAMAQNSGAFLIRSLNAGSAAEKVIGQKITDILCDGLYVSTVNAMRRLHASWYGHPFTPYTGNLRANLSYPVPYNRPHFELFAVNFAKGDYSGVNVRTGALVENGITLANFSGTIGPAATARMFSRRGWVYQSSPGKLALGGAIAIGPYISQFDAARERLTCLLQCNDTLARGKSAEVLAIRTSVETLHDRLADLTDDVLTVNPTWDLLPPATVSTWQGIFPSGYVGTQDASGVITRD